MEFRTWLQDNPLLCLAVLVALTGLAVVIEASARRRRRLALRELAADWRMTFSTYDRLRVAARIAHKLPVPGAADVCVTDLIYGAREGRYLYIFTAEYTTGVIWGKQRQSRVAEFSEPRDRQTADASGSVILAAEGLALIEQYRRLSPDRDAAR